MHPLIYQLPHLHRKIFVNIYFCISNFAPKFLIIFKKEGEDVYTVSKAEDIAIAESWMEFQTTDLQLNMTPVFWGLVRNPPEDRNQDLIDKNIILLNKKFEIFDKFLEGREYILNNEFGMSDIIMGVASYRYHSLPIERPNLSNLKNWYEKNKPTKMF